eukprot:gene3817-4075_t
MAPTLIADSTFDGSGLALGHHWVQHDAVSNVKLDSLKHRHTGKAATVKAAPPAGPHDQADVAAPAVAVHSAEGSAAAQFHVLCNDGSTWTWRNCWTKLMRFTFAVLKQIYLLFVTMSLPTNHLMLTFRTFMRDFDDPHCNADHLACKFRNAVMPARGRLHEQKSILIRINRFFIEFPVLGIPGIVRFIDVRTQWFDSGVEAAIEDGITQVVIIAAGYDTRAYRLARPGVRFYEIDLPHASRKKQELVADLLPSSQYPRPEYVAADLSKVKLADALARTSYDPRKRSLFIAEGLVYYLPAGAVRQALSCVSSIAPRGSRLMFDFLHLSTLSGAVWHPGFETLMFSVWNKGEVMYSGIDERPEAVKALLQLFNFKTQAVLGARDLVKRYLPHKSYRSSPPIVSPYFGYIAAEKL